MILNMEMLLSCPFRPHVNRKFFLRKEKERNVRRSLYENFIFQSQHWKGKKRLGNIDGVSLKPLERNHSPNSTFSPAGSVSEL